MQPQEGQGAIYANPQQYQQQMTTINQPYNMQAATAIVQDNKVKDPVPNLTIQNLRGMDQFKFVSSEMLRVLDLMQMKGQ